LHTPFSNGNAPSLLFRQQVSDAFAGPTVSFSLYVNGTEQKNFSEPLLLALPVTSAESAGAENCVGQPSVREPLAYI
jgi:hypothetical protein